jgi:hypothetical protein
VLQRSQILLPNSDPATLDLTVYSISRPTANLGFRIYLNRFFHNLPCTTTSGAAANFLDHVAHL